MSERDGEIIMHARPDWAVWRHEDVPQLKENSLDLLAPVVVQAWNARPDPADVEASHSHGRG